MAPQFDMGGSVEPEEAHPATEAERDTPLVLIIPVPATEAERDTTGIVARDDLRRVLGGAARKLLIQTTDTNLPIEEMIRGHLEAIRPALEEYRKQQR